MSEELKPCPFCGQLRPKDWTEINKLVLCPHCESVALRKNWNTRPIEDAQAKRIAELESILKETVELYGKPGGPLNVSSDPGGWIEKARKALEKDHE